MRKKYDVTSCFPAHRFTDVDNDMDEKNDSSRYGSRHRNERVKSRNLSEKKRRDQFNVLINELCSMVTSSNRKMDKSSVLRSAISFLRNHRAEMSAQQHSVEIQENWKPSFLSTEEFTYLMLEALDGFIMVFSCAGNILYSSESVSSLLGYLSSDIPPSVFDILHECDRSSLYKLITSPSENVLTIDVHMKRGPIHSHGIVYELVRLTGSFHHWPSSSSLEGSSMCNVECDSNSCSSVYSPMSSAAVDWPLCFVAMARLRTPQLLRIVSLSDEPKTEFTSRHSLEWTFLFLDHRAPPIIGYLPFEVLGTSGYDYYHFDDLESIATDHETLMQTGEGTSGFYRFLTKGQQWIWLQTRYYISYHQWSSKPEFIVCTNIVSSTEHSQNCANKSPNKVDAIAKKVSFSSQMFPAAQSSCLSPTLSVSSIGSLSSEHSGRCSVATSFQSNSVLLMTNHLYEDSSNTLTEKQSKPPSEIEMNLPITPTNHTLTLPTCSLDPSDSDREFIPSPATPVTVAMTQFLEIQTSLPSTTISGTPNIQCQSTSSGPLTNPSQVQLQDYLRQRHQVLQQQILQQQEELRRVSEQLMLVQFAGPNTVRPSSSLYPSPVPPTYLPISEGDIHLAYKAESVDSPHPSSSEFIEFTESHAMQASMISSNSYATPAMDLLPSEELGTMSSTGNYASSQSSQKSA